MVRRAFAAASFVGLVLVGCTALRSAHEEASSDEDAGSSLDASSSSDAGAGDAATCDDTKADPANCGACGHDCLGGVCNAGKCEPRRLLGGSSTPPASLRLFAGLEHAIVLGPSGSLTLVRARGDGQRTVTVPYLNDLTVDVPNQRLIGRVIGTLHEAPLKPGTGPVPAPVFTATPAVSPQQIQAYAMPSTEALLPVMGWEYQNGDERAYLVPAVDGGFTEIGRGMMFDCDTHWSNGSTLLHVGMTGTEIVSRAAVGGAAQTFATAPFQPCSPRAVGTSLYFFTFVAPSYAIVRRPPSGTPLATVATIPEGGDRPALAAGRDHLFWSDGATISRIDATGTTPEVLVEAPARVADLAFADGRLYWALADGSVWTVAE